MTQVTLIKVGGRIIDDESLQERFLDLFQQLRTRKLLVHGGGVIANQICKSLQIEPQMVDGRRITDAKTLDVVTMAYGGLINKQLTAKLLQRDCRAVGISGIDGFCIESKRRSPEPIDFGFVGDVKHCHTELLENLLESQFTPIVAPLTVDRQGQILNTNADTVATCLAAALSRSYQVRLLLVMDHNGVYQDLSDPTSHFDRLNPRTYKILLQSGVLKDGILPKLRNCFETLSHGVQEIRILSVDGLQRLVAGDRCGLGTRIVIEE